MILIAMHPPVLAGFHPERVLFRPGGVNPQACLCGVPVYASAQPLAFLARTENPRFPNRKQVVSHLETPLFSKRAGPGLSGNERYGFRAITRYGRKRRNCGLLRSARRNVTDYRSLEESSGPAHITLSDGI